AKAQQASLRGGPGKPGPLFFAMALRCGRAYMRAGGTGGVDEDHASRGCNCIAIRRRCGRQRPCNRCPCLQGLQDQERARGAAARDAAERSVCRVLEGSEPEWPVQLGWARRALKRASAVATFARSPEVSVGKLLFRPFTVPLIERLPPPCVINECSKCTKRRSHETLYDSRDCGAAHHRRGRPDRDRSDRA